MATLSFTKQDGKEAISKLASLRKRVASIREQSEQTIERIVTTAEVGGAAFAMGVLQGKTGGVEVFGVPLELGVGLGLNAFALLGGAGKAASHLHNVGNGCLAAYAATLGRGVGTSWASKNPPKQVAAAGVGFPQPMYAPQMVPVPG